ncbi:MAG TPA: S9 family peptidase [Candidatus Dormibacteraeota bacterium]|nr:S9 family peptidase [Candidatus Dormibacteraeota bacterium]
MTKLSLDGYNSIPRVGGMVLSPDGRRLVLTVQTLNADSTRFVTSLWEVPADGSRPPRRLTFSDKGEANPTFLADGSLVFTSGRTDPTVKEDEAESRLWVLPADGGEARPLLSVPGGIRAVAAARKADAVVIRAQLFPGADGVKGDADKGKKRKEAGVSAILYDTFPIRFWDHDLGPRWSRLLRLCNVAGEERPQPEDLTGDPVNSLEEAPIAVSPDGNTVVTTWRRDVGRGFRKTDMVAIAGGQRQTFSAGDLELAEPQISPDGRSVAAIAEDEGTPERATRRCLWIGDLASGKGDVVAPDFESWPAELKWSADGSSVFFAADHQMHRPVFRFDLATGKVTQITREGAFFSVWPDPSGECLYALRTSWKLPLQAVRIALDGTVTELPTPGFPLDVPGAVSPVQVKAADGTPVGGWLVMPREASPDKPAPLVLWIHGGPLNSWNSWSWRWNPHLLVEHGYAVLLPDPALSTGYGQAFIQRAWGTWGEVVMEDVFSVLDSVLERPDIDRDHVAAMGGSFGGYMANWVAGHSDRFRAIVTHASLWSMARFQATTDEPDWWEHQFGSPYEQRERYDAASPDESVAKIKTPMLVIHGNMDYRVPISEALQLWTALRRHDVPSQYLYFPDENHWVLKPGNALVWYQAVLAFLDHHVLGKDWARPDLL